MSDETVWEQIQAKSEKVEELDALYESTKTKFEADGTIDADEQKKLDEIKTGISTAKGKIKELETEFKANKKKWEGRAGDYNKARDQWNELLDWNDQADYLDAIDEQFGFIEDETKSMAWLNAIDELDLVMNKLEAPYKEFTKQKPFRDDYNKDRPNIEDQADDLSKNRFAEVESIAHSVETSASQLQSADEAAEALRYDDACRFLNDAKETLDDAQNDVTELTDKERKCRAEFDSVMGDAVIYAKSEFDSVQEMNEALEETREAMEEQLEAMEYDDVLAELKFARKKVDEMKAEQEAKEKEKAEYDGKEGVLNECNNKISEVASTTLKISTTVVSTASSLMKTATGIAADAAKQDWKGASEKIDGLKKDAEELYESFTDEKKKAEEKKAWDDRVGDVAEVKAECALLVEWGIDKAKDVQKTIEDAEKKAGSEDYVEAVATLDKAMADIEPLKEELDEEKKAELEYKGLKASFDAELQQIEGSDFAASKVVKAILDQIKSVVEPIAEHVAGKQFKMAKEVLEKAAEHVKKALEEIARLTGVQKTATDLYNGLKDKLEKVGEETFESMKDAYNSAKTAADEVGEKVESAEDPDDTLIAARDASAKGDELIKEYEEKVAQKKTWEKKQKDIDAVEKMVKQLQAMGSSSADPIRDEAMKASENANIEKFEEAVKQLDDAKSKAASAIEEEEEEMQLAVEEEEEEMQMAFGGVEKEFDEMVKQMKSA